MRTPTQKVIQRGSFANDGSGDTLRDAAEKINDNFTHLFNDTYDGVGVRPGRSFVLNSISGNDPDSGGFTIHTDNLDVDSTQYVRISRFDQDNKSFKSSVTDSAGFFSLSMWSLDSGQLDDWNLLARYTGTVQYIAADEYWRFTKTRTVLASQDGVDSGDTYYLKIDGIW